MESHSQDHHTSNDHSRRPSNSELMSSVKVLSEAANAGFHRDMDKIDKGKVAGATEDLIGAVSYYGKLEEKGFGKYLEKGEQYLHQYHSSQSPTATHSTATTTHHTSNTTTTSHSHSHPSGDGDGDGDGDAGAGGGGGGDGGHSESGGYGDYINMAQSFFKKQ